MADRAIGEQNYARALRLEGLLPSGLRFVRPRKFVNPRGIGDQQDAIRLDQNSHGLQRGALGGCHAVDIQQISVTVETQQHVADRGPHLLARAVHAQRVNHRLRGYIRLAFGELHYSGKTVQAVLPEAVAEVLAVLAVTSARDFTPPPPLVRQPDGRPGSRATSSAPLRLPAPAAARPPPSAPSVMFKSAAESAEARKSSGTKNSWRAEASARSPHAEQRVEVRRAV